MTHELFPVANSHSNTWRSRDPFYTYVRAKAQVPGDPTKESSLLLCLDATAADGYNPELMRVVFALRQRLLTLIAFAAVVLLLAACGNSGIVGKWRMSGIENQKIGRASCRERV